MADILTEARAAWPALEWQLDPEDAERAESAYNGSPLSVEPIDPSWRPRVTNILRFRASAVTGGAGPVDVEVLGRTVAEAVIGLRRRLECPMPADRPSVPDLTHQWRQPEPSRDPTWWECAAGCLSGHRGLPPSTLCPERVIAYADEQRTAGAAAERARIVEWLRTGPDRGRGTAAWDEAIAPIRAELADAIERGEDRTP